MCSPAAAVALLKGWVMALGLRLCFGQQRTHPAHCWAAQHAGACAPTAACVPNRSTKGKAAAELDALLRLQPVTCMCCTGCCHHGRQAGGKSFSLRR